MSGTAGGTTTDEHLTMALDLSITPLKSDSDTTQRVDVELMGLNGFLAKIAQECSGFLTQFLLSLHSCSIA